LQTAQLLVDAEADVDPRYVLSFTSLTRQPTVAVEATQVATVLDSRFVLATNPVAQAPLAGLQAVVLNGQRQFAILTVQAPAV